VWTIVQDHMNPNLLFVGSEFGMSFQRGWRRALGEDQRRDADHPDSRSDDSAARERPGGASFGRGFFVLDDFSALRKLTPDALAQEGALFAAGRPGAGLR